MCVECYEQDECEENHRLLTGSTYVGRMVTHMYWEKIRKKHRNVNSDHLCVVIPSMELHAPSLKMPLGVRLFDKHR